MKAKTMLCIIRTDKGYRTDDLIPRVDYVGGKGYELSYQVPGTLKCIPASRVMPISKGVQK